jgi:hypothetical protein
MDYQGYKILLDKERTAYAIHTDGRGALPKALSGLFSSPALAMREIDVYKNTKKPKE